MKPLEDLKTSLDQAKGIIASLSSIPSSYALQTYETSSRNESASGPSSSTAWQGQFDSRQQADRARVEKLNQLVPVLKGNIRVCYEVDFNNMVEAFVFKLAQTGYSVLTWPI